MHKKTIALLAGAATTAVIGLAGSAGAAPTSGDNLTCFKGGTKNVRGTCQISGSTVRLIAPGSGTGYAGVYYKGKAGEKFQGASPAAVDFAFDYSAAAATGGSPRFSIPIDTDGDGAQDFYAFLGWNSCAGNTEASGTVSSNNTGCSVDANNGTTYPNWDAFALTAEAEGWTIASQNPPFIIADYNTDVVLSNIQFTA